MKASAVIGRAQKILMDQSGKTWSEDELLEHLTAAQRAVITIKPSAYTKNETMQLEEGVKQESPGHRLYRVVRNMGTDGESPGRAVRRTDEDTLSRFRPDWASARQRTEIRHWMRDSNEPHVFYVDPPSDGKGHVEVAIAAYPDAVESKNDELSLGEHYEPALTAYVVGAALSKESDAQAVKVAQFYSESFNQLVAADVEAKNRWDPRGAMRRQRGMTNGED